MLPEEEAAGHDEDEDREKEILIERIQSIKEEKQVSLHPLPTLACTTQPHPPVPPLCTMEPMGQAQSCRPGPTSWRSAALLKHSLELCLNSFFTTGNHGAHWERKGNRDDVQTLS